MIMASFNVQSSYSSIHPSYSFIHSFIHPSIHSSIHPFIHSFIHSWKMVLLQAQVFHIHSAFLESNDCQSNNTYSFAISYLTKRKKNSLEKGSRFVHSLLQCLIQVIIQFPIHSTTPSTNLLVSLNIVQNRGKQNRVVKTSHQLGVHIRCENAASCKHGLRRPLIRLRNPKNLPMKGEHCWICSKMRIPPPSCSERE